MAIVKLHKNISTNSVGAASMLDYLTRHPPPAIGDAVPGEGIYLGQWAPTWRNGKSLGKIFNVYAAPEDIERGLTYVGAGSAVAALKNWHGHDGGLYLDDKEFLAALKGGRYHGEWIIPPRELVDGCNMAGEAVQADHLRAHHDSGALKDTFSLSTRVIGGFMHGAYWTSTITGEWGVDAKLWCVRLSDGAAGKCLPEFSRMNCRPVRLVPV